MHYYAYTYLLISGALATVDSEMEEAAATCGMGPWQRIWRITMPLLMPALGSAIVLTFIRKRLSWQRSLLRIAASTPVPSSTALRSVGTRVSQWLGSALPRQSCCLYWPWASLTEGICWAGFSAFSSLPGQSGAGSSWQFKVPSRQIVRPSAMIVGAATIQQISPGG